jgi:hypothetical protein
MNAHKKLIFGSLLLMQSFLPFSLVNAQSSQAETTSSNVVQAISKANAAQLSASFGNSIDLSLPSNDGTFSRTQAEMIIKEFFKKNPPKSFTIKQQGASNDGARFTIATYVSQNNSVYRTYFLVKKVDGSHQVQLLQFEQE